MIDVRVDGDAADVLSGLLDAAAYADLVGD
jgi:hypothetical protein